MPDISLLQQHIVCLIHLILGTKGLLQPKPHFCGKSLSMTQRKKLHDKANETVKGNTTVFY